MKIQQKVTSLQYAHMEDMVSDCVQMFDNACKYNEPDSLIYKVKLIYPTSVLVVRKAYV